MNIGIIGCGLIGTKRSKSLGENKLIAVADTNIKNARKLAESIPNIKLFSDYQDLIEIPEIDIVIVSTVNNMLAPITLESINHGKHVLVEKPCAINSNQIRELISASKSHNVKVKVGYTLRSHPALIQAKELVDSNTIGDLMFIRARYGHGGRLGYEKEWRSNPILSGGGELIDQGVHLIDLSRWFLGDFTKIFGSTHTYFWDMHVEDNAFLHLTTEHGHVAHLQVSCTEWKNMFSFEIYGKLGKIDINGLGGSYGLETLTLHKMLTQMGPPKTLRYEFGPNDLHWKTELDDLITCIKNNKQPQANLNDAFETLKIVEEIYAQTLNTNK